MKHITIDGKKFGLWLNETMDELGMPNFELVKRSGLSGSHISRYRYGGEPTAAHFFAVLRGLGVKRVNLDRIGFVDDKEDND